MSGPGGGLTSKGTEESRQCVRRHRLGERLFADVLRIKPGLVHEASCRFEHILHKGIEDNICILLGHPKTCPHGKPIPPGECCRHDATEISSLIIRLPPRMQASLSTDLERVAFSADIAPTLYQLAGQPVSDSRPPAGEALFVPPDGTLSDRRREAYLLTSSYGAAYGLLRENGRQLYLTDLIARREYAAYEVRAGDCLLHLALESCHTLQAGPDGLRRKTPVRAGAGSDEPAPRSMRCRARPAGARPRRAATARA